MVLRRGKKAAEVLVRRAVRDPVALANEGTGSVRVVLRVNGFVTVTTIVVSTPEKLKADVGVEVILAANGEVELGKKAPGATTSAAAVVMEVRVVLSVTGVVTVTNVVTSGPRDVGVPVMLAVVVLFGKKAPGTLAATVLFGYKGILKVVELDRLDDVKDGKEPL